MLKIINIKNQFELLWPGVCVAILIAISAKFLSNNYEVPSMLMAILIGMSLSFLSEEGKCIDGLNFSSKSILYIGIILLGSRISLEMIMSIDPSVLIVIILGVIFTIIFGLLILSFFGFTKRFGVLIGGAVAICGASAAMAIASVLPKDERSNERLSFVILGVTIISTFCMIIYPIISNYLFMDNKTAGIFFGATIHDVAQVIGAGFTISEETGETATLIKLFRVSLLFPTILIISLFARRQKSINEISNKAPIVPYFVIFFLIFALVNSFGLFSDYLQAFFSELSGWFLLIAIAAVGTKTRIQNLKIIGFIPAMLMVITTLFLLIFIILLI